MEDHRFRLEPARRSASTLLAAAGVSASRASALASHLLWFDAIGATDFGIATLPNLLEALISGAIDPKAGEKIGPERAATAVVVGNNGIGALVLDRAAKIAVEKARDVGVGMVRVRGIGATGPAAAVVADMAMGPIAALALGPGNAWSMALPSPDGIALVADSALGGKARPTSATSLWQVALEEGEWLIQAIMIPAVEPLSSLHERVASANVDSPSWLSPTKCEAYREEAHKVGIRISANVLATLRSWAERLQVVLELPTS